MVQQQYDNNNYTHCIYNKHATYYCCLANNAGRTLSNRTICSLFVNYYECDKSHVSLMYHIILKIIMDYDQF